MYSEVSWVVVPTETQAWTQIILSPAYSLQKPIISYCLNFMNEFFDFHLCLLFFQMLIR